MLLVVSFCLFFSLASSACPAGTTPVDCVTGKTSFYGTSSSTSVIGCFRTKIPGEDSHTTESHNNAVATVPEAQAMGAAAQAILYANGNCSFSNALLNDIYAVTSFTDSTGSYCILHEICLNSTTSKFYKGWGLFAGHLNQTAVLKDIHIQATHPLADSNTERQAAYVFVNTHSRSLLIAGSHRRSLTPSGESSCTCDTSSEYYGYWDPSHSNYLPFDYMSREVTTRMGTCDVAHCGLIQFHGMSSTSYPCNTTDAFISAGYDYHATNSPGKYDYATTGNPPHARMLTAIETYGGGGTWTANNPSTHECDLVARKNVQGRRANGVAEANICCVSCASPQCSPYASSPPVGYFLHIEQLSRLRDYTTSAYSNWVTIINNVY